jgi:uncharacterized protein (TIGR01777 family)
VKVFVTGGTGLVGGALVPRLLARGDEVAVLTRSAARARRRLPDGVDVHQADPTVPGPWQRALETCDAAVNLAGASIAGGRWTESRKRELRRSRLTTTSHLAAAVRESERCRVLASASATGFYGDRGAEALTETHEAGRGFLARLAHEWENAALEAEEDGTRVVCARIGVVLAREDGALPKMATPFKLGLGGKLGDGRQYFPWIHLDDLVAAIIFALDTPALSGPVNVVAPDPPTQSAFARALCATLGRPCIMRVPAFVLRLVLGEMSTALLSSERAVPNALKAAGFRFEHADLDAALADLLGGDAGGGDAA